MQHRNTRLVTPSVHTSLAAAFLAAIFVACGGPGDASPNPTSTASTSQSEPTFTRTIVKKAADGTETVTVSRITRAQQLAELKQRQAMKAGALVVETLYNSCINAYIDIWDQADFTGNEVCFYNGGSSPDYAYLPGYCEVYNSGSCTQYWAGTSIKSWDTGGQAASLTDGGSAACAYDCLTRPCICWDTTNLPAYSSACSACGGNPGDCNYCSPTDILSNMNYLWMNTGSGALCSSCSNN